jgi:FMN phosphatase YigB (HAD superfamily)
MKDNMAKLPDLIFDVDDCLYDVSNGLHVQLKKNLRAEESFLSEQGFSLQRDSHGHVTNFPKIFTALGEKSPQLQKDSLARLYNADYSVLKVNWAMVDAIKSYVDAGGRVGVYTASPYEPHAKKALQIMKLDKFFPREKVADLMAMPENQKPTVQGYLDACKILGFEPKDTIYFDDSINNLKAAEAVGAKTVWLNALKHPAPSADEAPHIDIRHQNEAATIVKNILRAHSDEVYLEQKNKPLYIG